jgi:hypothetical protein
MLCRERGLGNGNGAAPLLVASMLGHPQPPRLVHSTHRSRSGRPAIHPRRVWAVAESEDLPCARNPGSAAGLSRAWRQDPQLRDHWGSPGVQLSSTQQRCRGASITSVKLAPAPGAGTPNREHPYMTTNKGKRPATAVREGERACVIGAGSSGIASCQVLHARAIRFDCFEVGSEVGGNWRYMNDNAMSSAYRSLHINTSRDLMTFATFRCPPTIPTTRTTSRSRATSTRTSTTSGFAIGSGSAPRSRASRRRTGAATENPTRHVGRHRPPPSQSH